jgi:hypothetical protein
MRFSASEARSPFPSIPGWFDPVPSEFRHLSNIVWLSADKTAIAIMVVAISFVMELSSVGSAGNMVNRLLTGLVEAPPNRAIKPLQARTGSPVPVSSRQEEIVG